MVLMIRKVFTPSLTLSLNEGVTTSKKLRSDEWMDGCATIFYHSPTSYRSTQILSLTHIHNTGLFSVYDHILSEHKQIDNDAFLFPFHFNFCGNVSFDLKKFCKIPKSILNNKLCSNVEYLLHDSFNSTNQG